MSTAVSTATADYLDRVAVGLADLSEDDREGVLQDLRAHLAELDEQDIVPTLGSPEEFVAEFRLSAGLDEKPRSYPRLTELKSRIDAAGRRLAELTRWETVRPVWIWTRGWLVVSTIAVFAGGTAFRRFPIPVIENSSVVGLALVGFATWLSVWLTRRSTPTRMFGSAAFNVVAGLFLLASMLSSPALDRSSHAAVDPWVPESLVAADGQPVENIFAFDLDGNPVQVLLYDQDGRPLLSLPSWIYEEAEHQPAQSSPYEYGAGAVEFHTDDLGRIIPNLYPLDMYTYGEYGLEERPPPALGFPGKSESQYEEASETTVGTD